MRTLTKFMRNIGIAVIILMAVTIFNPVVVTRANEYSLIIQFGKVVRVEDSAGPSLKCLPPVRTEDTQVQDDVWVCTGDVDRKEKKR